MMDKISIIVPVYNVEKYVSRCIDSLISQTYKNIEIIIVDDGTKDDSGRICDQYAEKYNNISVIHTSNGGLASARNVGLQHITGEWVFFIDSDDFVTTDAIETLLMLCKQHNCDISIGDFKKYYNEEDLIRNSSEKYYIMNNSQAMSLIFDKTKQRFTAWGKLFKATLFNDIKFKSEARYAEDMYIMYKLFDAANQVIRTDREIYYYNQEGVSLCRSTFNKNKLHGCYSTRECLDFISKHYPTVENEAFAGYSSMLLNYCWQLRKNTEYDEFKRESISYLKNNRKKVRTNKDINIKNKIKGIFLGIYF